MDKVDQKQFLAIQTSMSLLRSVYDEVSARPHHFVSALEDWKVRHKCNVLAGANLLAFGWAVVVRFFELTKLDQAKAELPDELRCKLDELAQLLFPGLTCRNSLQVNYQCELREIDLTDSVDDKKFICSLIRHVRNAISHFDCEFLDDVLEIRLCHVFRGKEKLNMTIKLDGYLKLVGDIGLVFSQALVELNVLSHTA